MRVRVPPRVKLYIVPPHKRILQSEELRWPANRPAQESPLDDRIDEVSSLYSYPLSVLRRNDKIIEAVQELMAIPVDFEPFEAGDKSI